ncbi:ribosome-associated GTPase EngA [Methylobacterium sp. Leaf469]|jgi:GTP-binding protein|uniref:ribosome biogenesis GTPase Der n=1 Tax=unclassified Methylobacterium TaxID=2615210 RepID=UPI0007009AAD|nr:MULTISPECIES: ribosome biogenesis GTPase Der [unclassified Methylobacterium]USU30697.1 ribosome biogenesis GTPase Der [Methylobacterium sp. OTU13CASTA1]KQO70299.1 ribosome-associated GTPase EngA [Methylobacterium sp. Leaf87]KQP24255.1 ribosome-associated GTPase EngA [Methylobacterium sp. Leaf100]KQP31004.1 ribosome-associated GTPase EngA [Methylobacterium sp. Leaf102]KQP60209.1 ribosome-associated GTPase EngA [Methylobacterium sp. Leaf112]
MDMPTVAIVGRPNVGKSTLFNRLVGKKLALVDDRPGVTRDRREGDVNFGGLVFRIIDTAGLEQADADSLLGRMRAQTEAAILEADVVLFVIDARAGILPADQPFAELVRRAGCPVILIANKAESGAGLSGAYEAFSLGLGDPIPFSAEHGEGIGELHDALTEALPAQDEEDADEDPSDRSLKVAIVGRPNAGKSTLINRMLGEERLLVGPEAGITRDSISLDWVWRGRRIKLHDTAGMRRKARIDDKLEKLAVSDGLRAVRFAEVVVVLLDATIPFEKQDLTIVDLIESEGRALVIGLNKWDLVADQNGLLKKLREDCTRLLPQVRGVPVVPLSGLAGEGIDKLMQAVTGAEVVWNTRVSTSRINDWLSAATQRNPPPAVSGRRIKIRYATQVKSRPPHFALFGNQLDGLPKSYTRYLVNGLRESFELPGVPIRLSLRTSKNPFDKDNKG